MSGGLKVFDLKEDDVKMMLCTYYQIGSSNVNFQMRRYIYATRADGVNIINIRLSWEKIILAARAIVAIQDHRDVFAISSRPSGHRAVLKYAAHTGASSSAGRFTPGMFTNQIQKGFREPRLIIVTDPNTDHQPIKEASYVNIPVIAFCNLDASLKFVDIAIPCNTKGKLSVGLMWWFLTREVLRLRGVISREEKWNVVVDLYFHREAEEVEKEETVAKNYEFAEVEVDKGNAENWGTAGWDPETNNEMSSVLKDMLADEWALQNAPGPSHAAEPPSENSDEGWSLRTDIEQVMRKLHGDNVTVKWGNMASSLPIEPAFHADAEVPPQQPPTMATLSWADEVNEWSPPQPRTGSDKGWADDSFWK